jgi:hypothetical protein
MSEKMKEEKKITLPAALLKGDQSLLVGNSGSYRVLKTLGLAGATARVYLVKREQDERFFALKLMQPGLSPEMGKRFRDEMVNLQRLGRAEDYLDTHHIPRIIESSDLQQPATQELFRLLGSPFIIMDAAEGTDVNTLLMDKNVLNEADALEISRQFARVLYVIHSENLSYTDMKLNNLIWNGKTRHLMVIDWNVIAENQLETDAPKDRLQAAAYLYQMVTGVPMELDISRQTVSTQRYRRLENFKSLSEGTRAFLVKAFHPDRFFRHGGRGPQLTCTREFLKALEIHADRFKCSTDALILKGRDTLKERQWQEALEYLDIAHRQADIEKDPAQFSQLQEDLEKAESEAKKLGRNAFFSGQGRYLNGLFAEALEDFEKAMRDDPYDEEARLFAIAAKYAIEVGEGSFKTLKDPLEECIRALLKGHLDLAANALNRLPAPSVEVPANRSLQAEIKVRDAVRKGQHLLKEDKIEEAQAFFRSAYQERDHILYVEPLEENLGSLTELYHKVEELKELYKEGEAYFKEERFHEAAWIFWKARGISQGSKHAGKRYQCASSLDTIKRLMEAGKLEQAVEECSQASGRFGDESKLMSLQAQVVEARCEQLRSLANEAYQARKYDAAKEYILEILKWRPDDGPAKTRLEDIRKEIASGYQERIQERESKLREKPSIEACNSAIRFVEDQGFQVFDEGSQFIKRTEALKENIASLSNELDDAISPGDLQAQLDVLNRAIAKNWVLRQGDPYQLKNELKPKILEKDIDRIRTHLRYCRARDAQNLCDLLLQAELPGEKKSVVEELRTKSNRLIGVLEELNRIKSEKAELSGESEEAELEKLRLERDYLRTLHRMKQIEIELEAPEEIREYEEKRATFLKDVENVIKKSRLQGHNCLSLRDFNQGRKLTFHFNEILSMFKECAGDGHPALEKWQHWSEEFNDLFMLIEKEPPDGLSDFSTLREKLGGLVRDPELKKVISALNNAPLSESEPDQPMMDRLASFTEDSPIAFWFHELLEQALKTRAFVKEHSDHLESLFKQLTDTREDHSERLHLEDKAKQEILEIREFDSNKAGYFEDRLAGLLKGLLNLSSIDMQSQEERKRLWELQRRICEKYQGENIDDININTKLNEYRQDNYFKGVIPRYKEQYTNALYRLKKRKKGFTEAGIEELLGLREEYGEFPELNAAIRQTRTERFRKKNKDRFDTFSERFNFARTQEDWQKLQAELDEIDSSLLSESDQLKRLKMAGVIDNHRMVNEIPDKKDFEKYLENDENERVQKWLRSLEWNLEERNRVDIPPLTIRNLMDCEKNWFARGELDVKSLRWFRWVNYLIQELDKLRSYRVRRRNIRSKQKQGR